MFQKLLAERNLNLIETAYVFFKKELNISKEQEELIQVKLVPRLRNALGTCAGIYVKNELSRIEISILQTSNTIGIIETLAHELIHAKQNLDGHFCWIDVKKKIFFGLIEITVKERAYKKQILSETPYYDQECEQEAHTLSLELVSKFMKHIHDKCFTNTDVLMVETF